jgi:hypothetical protein
MNVRQIHNLAHLSGSIYKIVYTSMLLYCLMRRKANEPMPPPPEPRRYH